MQQQVTKVKQRRMQPTMAERLLATNANVNAATMRERGGKALHVAVEGGYLAVIERLHAVVHNNKINRDL